ncbi:hypothetical protein HMN09_00458100 [Mycena chlorophos]|uniref:Mid2 domain-containing protein n=1 Tax=Mycena chlorophos TaxID=658473 RepID=A0A8H6TK85_MYCCL|nr:hypothetical protein HMN09_00458100 [Mycena chlorophos]
MVSGSLLATVFTAAVQVLAVNRSALNGTVYAVTVPQTLTGVQFVSQSLSFLPIATGADGETTYLEQEVESYDAEVFPSTTLVQLSTPTTFDWVFAESSGGFRQSLVVPDQTAVPTQQVVVNCTFTGTQGKAICLEVVGFYYGPETSSVSLDFETQTFTGLVVPTFTYFDVVLSSQSAASLTTPPSASLTPPRTSSASLSTTSGVGPPGSQSKHKSSAGAIAGGVIGGLVGVAIVLGSWMVWLRRRRKRDTSLDESLPDTTQIPNNPPLSAAPPTADATMTGDDSVSGTAAMSKLLPVRRATPTTANNSAPVPPLTGGSAPPFPAGNASGAGATDSALAEQVRLMAERMALVEDQLRMRGGEELDNPPRYSTS